MACGGEFYCAYSSSPTITNCTLSGSSAGVCRGIYCIYSSPTLTNCILRGSTIYCTYEDLSRPSVTYSNVEGGYKGEGNIDLDPRFVDAAAGDFRLNAGSTGEPIRPFPSPRRTRMAQIESSMETDTARPLWIWEPTSTREHRQG